VKTSHEIAISCLEDINRLRYITRRITREIKGSLTYQAHISWVTDYLARHMVSVSVNNIIMLTQHQFEERSGIEIACSGNWLRPLTPFFSRNAIPIIARMDEVHFTDGDVPQLEIFSWLRKPGMAGKN
jgi:hypothetical protein